VVSPQDVVCRVDRLLKRSERWSILLALTCDGYIDWVIHHGAINAELFIQFLEERVLPNRSPYPGKMSAIIMDNASIHKNPRLREICDNAGVLLVFLLPYSPDFNPIESTFKDLKAWIKKHYQQVEDYDDFAEFLEHAVSEMCGRDARGHFRACGYVVEKRI
jgi:transposase